MWWKIRLFLLYETSNGCHQATHNILLAHFEYPDSKIKTDILWIQIFVSALGGSVWSGVGGSVGVGWVCSGMGVCGVGWEGVWEWGGSGVGVCGVGWECMEWGGVGVGGRECGSGVGVWSGVGVCSGMGRSEVGGSMGVGVWKWGMGVWSG